MWQCGSYSVDLSEPVVMGVVNLHPASFVSHSYRSSIHESIEQALNMVTEGAAIIDLGAEPTNPQQTNLNINAEEELERLLPVLRALVKEVSVPISIDTSQPKVMQAVWKEGASIINDTRALTYEGAIAAIAATDAGLCLMHQGDGSNVQAIGQFLRDRAALCVAEGIDQKRIVLDPGIGNGRFGKSSAQNCSLLNRLEELCTGDYPLLVGVSRKTFIGDVLDLPEEDRLVGSLAAMIIAYQHGARILRVHDVAASVQALKMIRAIESA